MSVLFPENKSDAGEPAELDNDVLSEVFAELQKPLLRRLGDTAEKCRELSAIMLTKFIARCEDLGPVLPYLYPAVMDRNSDTFIFDLQNNEMVRDVEAHEAKQRGKAIPLPDGGTTLRHTVREPSEEVRLLLCTMLATLVRSFTRRGLHSMLGPYFHDTVMFFHACAVDPFPALRIEGMRMLQEIAQERAFENTMHHYCTALVRSLMPALRHRRSAVKIAAIRCIGALVACPYRNKCKGGGTDAIVDLMGFREDNVIPICAFYQGETRLNYLGHLVTDENATVRLELYKVLGNWLTGLLDRWDHAVRLLPFLLSALSDSFEPAQNAALETLEELGRQYEEEHHDEIIEKRQYGVDGAQGRANYNKPLPSPWKSRPRLGTRMYVRQHCRRFLHTVLRELQDWKATTRGHAVGLLRTMLVYMEEHVTMELNGIIDTYYRFAVDAEIQERIAECAELTGRYVDPDAYLTLILPHIEGADGSRSLATDARWTATGRGLVVLGALLDGSLPTCVVPHFSTLVRALSEQQLVRAASQQPSLCRRLVRVMRHPVMLLSTSNGRAAADAHFLATGRLNSLRHEAGDLLVSAARLLVIGDVDESLAREVEALLDALVPVTNSFGGPGHLLCERLTREQAGSLGSEALAALGAFHKWMPSEETQDLLQKEAVEEEDY
ncbi:Dynein assembly factor 5, axonemal [Hondaea fermentalgiana]|uniref:Dynein assembly factor 5, axonemal n=1 Tax=Hondaea fermentalgiana TaxID=2315210 RepID=A0A2R5GQZ3_9STRA|nr:Dynein assembly factor 5, axonemal [Hondaea fermentalgiana]|eukprot:GBG31043.1 Dynein assembly factor 5, axonemal [Hondaea fermentalgiana]